MEQEPIETSRWSIAKDSLVFQIKLALDALRDLLLSPVSIICALIDIASGHSKQQSYFYKLMQLGHVSDHWLNLFGPKIKLETNDKSISKALKNEDIDSNEDLSSNNEVNVDALFNQLESLLKTQHAKGGLTATAKTSIDSYIDKIVQKQAKTKPELKDR